MCGLEMKRLACLSTAHVTAEVAAELDWLVEYSPPVAARANPEIWQGQIVAIRWQEYGWFVWVPSPGRAQMPECLRACLDFVSAAGADWLMFDRDCPPIADLVTHDW